MNSVLYIGPDHRNHRGGIGAVLDVYSKNITPFKFIPTYVTKSFPKQFAVYVSAIFKLIWICITDRQVKILHIHHASRGSFMRKSLLVLIGKIFGKKIILHIHGGGFHNFYKRSRLMKPVIRWALQTSDAVICLSEMWKKYYSSTFTLKRLVIINNVIEKPSITTHVQNGTLNLLFLGHINQKKGVFDLLQVLASNRDQFKHKVKVTFGGIGEVERLEKEISENNFNGDVNFAGWVNGEKKAELLNKCDVYILPSYFEALPISILEAMSYGKPVISTFIGGIPEIVKPGFNGWLFEPGDKSALGTIIAEAMSNKELLKQYGSNSLSIAKNYTPESVFQSLKELYQQILTGN
ncbi:MAG: glycosyltransferase family 4 protein [Chitinophagaceae bacterium]|nr:glycosyltransferase family 4 protein [Chitinophagaceae bacterium]